MSGVEKYFLLIFISKNYPIVNCANDIVYVSQFPALIGDYLLEFSRGFYYKIVSQTKNSWFSLKNKLLCSAYHHAYRHI